MRCLAKLLDVSDKRALLDIAELWISVDAPDEAIQLAGQVFRNLVGEHIPHATAPQVEFRGGGRCRLEHSGHLSAFLLLTVLGLRVGIARFRLAVAIAGHFLVRFHEPPKAVLAEAVHQRRRLLLTARRDPTSVRGGVRRIRVLFRLLLCIVARIIVIVQIIVVVINRRVFIIMAIRFGSCRVISRRRAAAPPAPLAPFPMRFCF